MVGDRVIQRLGGFFIEVFLRMGEVWMSLHATRGSIVLVGH